MRLILNDFWFQKIISKIILWFFFIKKLKHFFMINLFIIINFFIVWSSSINSHFLQTIGNFGFILIITHKSLIGIFFINIKWSGFHSTLFGTSSRSYSIVIWLIEIFPNILKVLLEILILIKKKRYVLI